MLSIGTACHRDSFCTCLLLTCLRFISTPASCDRPWARSQRVSSRMPALSTILAPGSCRSICCSIFWLSSGGWSRRWLSCFIELVWLQRAFCTVWSHPWASCREKPQSGTGKRGPCWSPVHSNSTANSRPQYSSSWRTTHTCTKASGTRQLYSSWPVYHTSRVPPRAASFRIALFRVGLCSRIKYCLSWDLFRCGGDWFGSVSQGNSKIGLGSGLLREVFRLFSIFWSWCPSGLGWCGAWVWSACIPGCRSLTGGCTGSCTLSRPGRSTSSEAMPHSMSWSQLRIC